MNITVSQILGLEPDTAEGMPNFTIDVNAVLNRIVAFEQRTNEVQNVTRLSQHIYGGVQSILNYISEYKDTIDAFVLFCSTEAMQVNMRDFGVITNFLKMNKIQYFIVSTTKGNVIEAIHKHIVDEELQKVPLL